MNAPIVIETERLILRPHVAGDWNAVHALWSDPKTSRFISGKPSTREESWWQLLRYLGLWPALGFGYFAVVEKATQEFIGEIGLADFHRDIMPSLEGTAEMGWILLPRVWGKGYAQEAITAIFDWYASTSNPRPFSCFINKDNLASIQLAHRTGFRLKAETVYKGNACLMFERPTHL